MKWRKSQEGFNLADYLFPARIQECDPRREVHDHRVCSDQAPSNAQEWHKGGRTKMRNRKDFIMDPHMQRAANAAETAQTLKNTGAYPAAINAPPPPPPPVPPPPISPPPASVSQCLQSPFYGSGILPADTESTVSFPNVETVSRM